MFYIFVLSVMIFDSIAFHHLETHCLGRQAWRVPVLCSNPFPVATCQTSPFIWPLSVLRANCVQLG